MAPQQIGQFTILAELAQSGGGVVYKASDPKGRTVALRTVRLDAPGAAEIVPGFRAAARAASGLSSPNVAAIFGGGEAGGVFFVAVEFVEGVKLSSTLAKSETAPMSEVIDLCRQVCTGLDHAHAKGILHPELKPSNIIVEWDGTAKIMDFGVPRKHPAGGISEATHYLSPEEVRGEALSPRSNLFSWGAMLYQMVSGHKPFNALDAEALRRKIVEEMPVPPHELNPEVHPRVSEIILKALAKAPEERYGSGAELVSDLENYKRVEAASPRPAAGTQVWSPAGNGALPVPAASRKPHSSPPGSVAMSKPQPAPAPVTKPRAAPVLPKPAPQEPPPAPAPVAAAPKAEQPAAAKPAAKAPPRNPLLYAMAGVIALLLIVIVVGAFWLLSPAKHGTAATGAAAPSSPPATEAPAAQPALPAPTPATTARAAKPKPVPALAAPVAAPVATGGLSLDSSPQGAEVQIDGRHEAGWITPFTAAGLAVGPHTVNFSKPGHTVASRTAQVAAGQNAVLAVQLAELAATLSVNSDPAGATVTLDGKDTGKVTPAQIVVAKGSHTVAVHKQGYLDASGTLETAPGQTAQFNPTLKVTGSTENIKTVGKLGGLFGGAQENSGRVLVRTTPKGAEVRVNGQSLKKTAPVEFFLSPGSYEISLTLEGYKPVKKIVDVEKGGKLTVDETLTH
jgi:serine/threonine-protein kinase